MRIPSSVQTLLRSLEVQNFSLNAIGVRPAEIEIEPEGVDCDLSEFMRARELFVVAEEATLVQIPKSNKCWPGSIRRFLLDPAMSPTEFETVTELKSA